MAERSDAPDTRRTLTGPTNFKLAEIIKSDTEFALMSADEKKAARGELIERYESEAPPEPIAMALSKEALLEMKNRKSWCRQAGYGHNAPDGYEFDVAAAAVILVERGYIIPLLGD